MPAPAQHPADELHGQLRNWAALRPLLRFGVYCILSSSLQTPRLFPWADWPLEYAISRESLGVGIA